MDKHLFSLVALSATDLIGRYRFNKIKNNFDNINDFLDTDIDFQMEFLDVQTAAARNSLLNMKKSAEMILEKCTKQNIQIISDTDSRYPDQLKHISDFPYLLYTKGVFNQHIPLVAVIGTRKSTPDVENVNKWFCKEFVQYGIGVVSGLAAGHDSIAAHAVLQHEGFTVGVLGTAIDVVYPTKSRYLYDQISEKGLLLSEYPPGMATTKWRFPRRNRIVSGMAESVLVVQAPEKSGTMITVKMAENQGKDVYVIPGNPLIESNTGTNKLIQQGTKVAIHPQDIIQETLKTFPNFETMSFIKMHKKEIIPKSFSIDPSLPLEERTILELTQTATHIDDIVRAMKINTSSVTSLLTMMEIRGLIKQLPGQLYIREEL